MPRGELQLSLCRLGLLPGWVPPARERAARNVRGLREPAAGVVCALAPAPSGSSTASRWGQALPPSASEWQGGHVRRCGRGSRGRKGSPAWQGLGPWIGPARMGRAGCPDRRSVRPRALTVSPLRARVTRGEREMLSLPVFQFEGSSCSARGQVASNFRFLLGVLKVTFASAKFFWKRWAILFEVLKEWEEHRYEEECFCVAGRLSAFGC